MTWLLMLLFVAGLAATSRRVRCLTFGHRLCGCRWCVDRGFEVCVRCRYENAAFQQARRSGVA